MTLQGSLACLLLALCLGSGDAGPLLSGKEDAGAGVGEAFGHWGTNGQPPPGGYSQGYPGGPVTPWGQGPFGGADGSSGTNSQGGSWGLGGNREPSTSEASAQGAEAQPGPGSVRSGNPHTECTNPPPSGSGGSSGHLGGSSSSSGSSGSSGSGSSSGGSSGSSSDGSSGTSWEYNTGSSPGSDGGIRGGNKPGCDNPGNEVHVSGGSGGQQPSGGGEAVSGVDTLNSQTSPGLFNFDTFWKNFKSKLGFINWDAINKGQAPAPNTRALLYFRRLWEDFKRNTPFLNWKEITEGADVTSLQKRAGGAGQPGSGWQDVAAVTSKNNYNRQAYPTVPGGQSAAKIPPKGGATISSSASRAQPGMLQWVKFW
nr:PREDICTED: dermokine isoform X2 [Equus przewalskii]